MGAKVIIAEIDEEKGSTVQKRINSEFNNDNIDFYQIDITDERQVDELYGYIIRKYSKLDVLIHNAAVVPMGSIESVPISDWDLSYAVNMRAPVLLTQKFLPMMKENGGVIVFVPSVATTPYMSAYEMFKAAQVEMCHTLREEISQKNIMIYSIAPGFVKTETANKAVETVAAALKVSTDEFYLMHKDYIIDVEKAGIGYALSVVNASQYDDKETMSYQVLMDAD